MTRSGRAVLVVEVEVLRELVHRVSIPAKFPETRDRALAVVFSSRRTGERTKSTAGGPADLQRETNVTPEV